MSLVGNFTSNDDKQTALTSSPYHNQRHHVQDGGSDDATLDGSRPVDDDESDARRGQDIHNLARTMSHRSSVHAGAGDPLNPTDGSIFDPWGDKFDPKAWSKAVVQLASQDEDAPPRRRAGVAFDNLNVHGFGSDFEYQTTVGNGPLKAWGGLKSMIGSKGKRKAQILQGVDGVLHPGEMLVVLGPPGRCAQPLSSVLSSSLADILSWLSAVAARPSSRRSPARPTAFLSRRRPRSTSVCSLAPRNFAASDPACRFSQYRGVTPKQMHKNFAGEAV